MQEVITLKDTRYQITYGEDNDPRTIHIERVKDSGIFEKMTVEEIQVYVRVIYESHCVANELLGRSGLYGL